MSGSSFFTTLAKSAGTKQQENQLSRTFEACFGESASFRQTVLALLWHTCAFSGSPPSPSDWTCRGQQRTPLDGGGYPDITIRRAPEHSGFSDPVFHLESKVAAPLTAKQLNQYRKNGCDYVVAVTKRHPEVLPRDITKLGAFALRWQDIHRALSGTPTRSPRERFVRDAFLTYLEDLDMAHGEKITKSDLQKLSRVLAMLRSPRGHIAMADSFRTAESVGELLENVRVRLQELHPRLRKWSKPRPYCGLNLNDGENDAYIGLSLRQHSPRRTFYLALGFPINPAESVFADVWLQGHDPDSTYARRPIQHFLVRHCLNEDRLFTFANAHAKQWGLVK